MTVSKRMHSMRLQLAGVAMVATVAGVVALAFAQFNGDFTKTSTITVSAPRAGLVMNQNAEVKLRGVKIGRVTAIDRNGTESSPGTAQLTLALDPDSLRLLPTNVAVDIESTTVFGAKYVNFELPAKPAPTRLTAGATVSAKSVTVEYDTLFQHLSDLLGKVQPQKVNATLEAIATALRGQGAQLGELVTQADSYLATINPTLPTLQQDFDKVADVSNLYAETGPNLLTTVSNATVTSDSIVAEQHNLDAVLVSVLGLNAKTGTVLRQNQTRLATALDVLRPTTAVLGEYAPAINCTVMGLDNFQPVGERMFGGDFEGVGFNSSFMPPPMPYQVPEDLPKVAASGGPNCWGLPYPPTGKNVPNAPYVVTDNAVVPYAPSTHPSVGGPNVFSLLFDGLTPTGLTSTGAPVSTDQPKKPGVK